MTTRTAKVNFSVGERVLCYEPDTRKAKVLYNSKVLHALVKKDNKGRKTVEYLIHFQGWNSSWDRYVREEFVLRDNIENRQLQRDLAEQSQLYFGVYLYRERKKEPRKMQMRQQRTSAIRPQISEPSVPATLIETIVIDDPVLTHCSTQEDIVVEEDAISIELNDYLTSVLERDYELIKNRNKLMNLPALPSIDDIFELYWQYYSSALMDKQNEQSNRRLSNPVVNVKPEDIQQNLLICKQMLDGLRLYFDFTVENLLLYKSEKKQSYLETPPILPATQHLLKKEIEEALSSGDITQARISSFVPNEVLRAYQSNNHINRPVRKRNLRSNTTQDASDRNGNLQHESTHLPTKEASNIGIMDSDTTQERLDTTAASHLMSNDVFYPYTSFRSKQYGATHLLRMFVKLPELLNASWIPENKLKVLHQHLENFLNFLSDHKEWFGDKHYVN